jgi:N-ethylmaleimide reductase
MGRAGHSDVFGTQPVSASALPLEGEVTARNGEKKPYEVPRELTIAEIRGIVADYAHAAANALRAGFDGVQLHSANGYLIDQFMQSCSNHRTDEFGGSIANRLRFLKEVLAAVTAVVPAERVWVRFSPNSPFNGMGSADNLETFDAAISLAASFRVGCVEVLDGLGFGFHQKTTEPYTLARARAQMSRESPSTAICGNVTYSKETAEAALAAGHADFITFGRIYMSNPDLPERFRHGLELAPAPEYPDWWVKTGADGFITFPAARQPSEELPKVGWALTHRKDFKGLNNKEKKDTSSKSSLAFSFSLDSLFVSPFFLHATFFYFCLPVTPSPWLFCPCCAKQQQSDKKFQF